MPSPHCSLWLKKLRGNLPLKVAAKDLRYADILRMVAQVAQQQVCALLHLLSIPELALRRIQNA
jgi:hypothetical protein